LLLAFSAGLVGVICLRPAHKASALCANANSTPSDVSSIFPRRGIVKNSADCSDLPLSNSWVFLSSYYYNDSSSYSTLYTPTAQFNLYFIGKPAVAQQVTVRAGSGRACGRVWVEYKDGAQAGFLGTDGTITFTVPAADYVKNSVLGADVYLASGKIVAQRIADQTACPIRVGVVGGGLVGMSSDANPSLAWTEANQRYNQKRTYNEADRKPLGPTGSLGSNQAMALWSNSSVNKVEYDIPFAPRCDITTDTNIKLRVYDGDGDSRMAPIPSGVPNPLQPPGDTAMKVYDTTDKVLVLDVPNVVSSNDEYNEYPMTVKPGHKYLWVWYNLKPHNGVQIWLPFSDIAAGGLSSCDSNPPTVRCSPSNTASVGFSGTEYGVPGTLEATVLNGSDPGIKKFTITGGSFSAPGLATTGAVSIIPVPPVYIETNDTGQLSQTGSFNAVGNYTVTATINWSAENVAGGVLSGSLNCSGTVSISALPYLRTYGSDVWAGGAYSAPCNINANIYALARNSSGYIGSGAQYGVTALLNIKGFFSSSLRVSGNLPAKGYSFSNTVGDPDYGGQFRGAGICLPDYYNDTQDNPSTVAGNLHAVLTNAPAGRSQYLLNSNPLSSQADVVPNGKQIAVYYDGDVTIKNNITYDTSGRASYADIPYFVLVARGNIYIDPSVTRLDGLYIAQSTTADNGKLYTCWPIAEPVTANIYDTCNQQLVINGAVVANEVKFFRTNNSLRDSSVGERPNFGTGTGTKAAEVINFTPELYMGYSPLKIPGSSSGSTGVYDAIFSLPPVF